MAKLYTYAEAPVPGLVRKPKDKHMAAGYVAGMAGVNNAVRARAELGLLVAQLVLDGHVSDQMRSSHPTIRLFKGDRTDYHIVLEVEADGEEAAQAAAYSIENGRQSYIDSKGRRQPATSGVHALRTALEAMGGIG